METVKDIFDQLEEEDQDTFDELEQEDNSIGNIKQELIKTLQKFDSEFDAKERRREKKEIIAEIMPLIQAEIAKIKPKQNIIERTIQKEIIQPPQVIHLEPKIVEAPPQIIKEVRVEVEKQDKTKYVEESKYLDLLVKISKLESQLKETKRLAEFPIVVGGPGVIGIPPPEPNPDGYVLTVAKGKATWKQGSGSSSSDAYTTSNVTTTTNLDPTTSTIDQLYNVVASLIVSLQGAGIIQ